MPGVEAGPDLQLEAHGAVWVVWFNRPDRLNAFRDATFDGLHQALDGLAVADDVAGVVLTGRGRAFCAGEDLDEMNGYAATGFTVREGRRQLIRLQALTRTLLAFPKPVAAAINGPAVGLGAELPLACRIRVASSEAYFQYPEARRGMLQTNGAFHFLPRMAGAGRAAEWLLTGRRVSADEARSSGLVSDVVRPSDLVATAVRLADPGTER